MNRSRILVLVSVVLLAAAGWAWFGRSAGPGAPAPARRNVVLITIDTLRADRVGRGLTPHIDRLAARGVSVPGVRATAPLTLPSHVSLMTGAIPPTHGVRENGVVFDRKTKTLAQVLKENGYRTGAFVGAYVLNRRFGLEAGFDTYDDAVKRDAAKAELLEAERPGGAVVDAALSWLGGGSGPFLLWVHMYDPHAPYEPPAEFRRPGGDGYDGEVAYADAQVGRLLDALDTAGLTGNTIVALTGDHGESLGEHGERTHGMLLYDGALRVPLVLAGPSVKEANRQPCHQDLAAALLTLAGLEEKIPQTMTGRPDASGGGGAPSACDSYSETLYPRRAGWHALTALSDGRWKLIQSSEGELYDLKADPREERNVAPQNPSIVDGMAAALARVRPAAGEEKAQIAPEAAERLRALGYVSGSSAIRSDDPAAPNPARTIAAWTEFERALGALHAGRAADAVRSLRTLAAQHPGAPVFQTTYAQALKESGDPRAAVAIYKAAVAKWPSDPALFHDLAAAAREAGDVAEATRAEQAALALDSTSAMAQNGMGLLHADAGRLTEAAAAFERAVEQDPSNPSYWTNLGNARRGVQDMSGAEAAYTKALAQDADHADALNGLAVIRVQGGRAADAIPLLERALRRDPAFHEARLNLGIAYQESGQKDKAAATYRELLATAPRSAEAERSAATQLLQSLGQR